MQPQSTTPDLNAFEIWSLWTCFWSSVLGLGYGSGNPSSLTRTSGRQRGTEITIVVVLGVVFVCCTDLCGDGIRFRNQRQEGTMLRCLDGLQRLHDALRHARRVYCPPGRLLWMSPPSQRGFFSLPPQPSPTLFSLALLLYPLYSLALLNPSVWCIRASWWDEGFVIIRSPLLDP